MSLFNIKGKTTVRFEEIIEDHRIVQLGVDDQSSAPDLRCLSSYRVDLSCYKTESTTQLSDNTKVKVKSVM